MTGSSFVKLVAVVVALGLTYGVAFGGGTLYGRSTAPEGEAAQAVVALPTAIPAAEGQPQQLTFTPEDVTRFREQLSQQFGGQVPQGFDQALDQFRDGGTVDLSQLGGGQGAAPALPGGQRPGFLIQGGQPGGQAGPGAGAGAALRGGGAVSGKVTSISTAEIILETAQGPVTVAVQSTTTVQTVSQETLAALKTGDEVQVRGVRQADGSIQAVAITRQPTP